MVQLAICEHEIQQQTTGAIEEIKVVLHQFQRVFQIPNSLPLKRRLKHGIQLKEDTDPINVRPYRYPQFQKMNLKGQFKR